MLGETGLLIVNRQQSQRWTGRDAESHTFTAHAYTCQGFFSVQFYTKVQF